MNRRKDATVSTRKLAGTMAALATAAAVHGQTVLYVDDDAPAGGNGQTWNDAFQDLQDALWVASYIWDDVEIRIADGIYKPDRGTGIKDIPFGIDHVGRVSSGLGSLGLVISLKGAFAGVTAIDPNERDTSKYSSVLSGDLNGDDLPGFVNYEDNSQSIFEVILSEYAMIELDGLVFRGANGSSAMRLADSPVTVRDCVFRANRAVYGGALRVDYGESPTLEGCFFGQNFASLFGGAVFFQDSNSRVSNCVFSGNKSEYFAGAIYSVGDTSISESTFFGNSAGIEGGGILCNSNETSITNSILVGNTPDQVANGHRGILNVAYSNVQDGYPGIGNIDTDPLFTNPLGDDGILGTPDDNFLPRFGSPVIDAGSNDWVINPLGFDYLGQPRIVDDRFTPDTGVGTGAIVDMGAYEFQPPTCYADLDVSTGVHVLDIFDFLRFQQLFVMNDSLACQIDRSTGNNICDIFDFLAFQSEFSAGCP